MRKLSHRLKFILVYLLLWCFNLNAQDVYRITAQKVNVRTYPSTQSVVAGSLSKNDTIEVSQIVKGWAMIKYKGKLRYVSARYIEKLVEARASTTEVADTLTLDTIKPSIESSIPLDTGNLYEGKDDKSFSDRFWGSSQGNLFVLVDMWGGFSNYSWSDGTPQKGLGLGIDVGVQCNYMLILDKIPKGLFGEATMGYARRGSGAFPINYLGCRLLPIAYRQSFSEHFALNGKAGLYMGIPFSNIETSRGTYNTCFDYGLSVGVGVEYYQWGVLISYEHGFARTIDNSRVDLYNRNVFLTLSYKFLKIK